MMMVTGGCVDSQCLRFSMACLMVSLSVSVEQPAMLMMMNRQAAAVMIE